MQAMHEAMQDVDVVVTPSYGGNILLLTNLTGHPTVVLPNGFTEENTPVSLSFVGRLFGEGDALLVARAYQEATDFHTQYPPLFQVGA
jgi:Asp-tRNA(Asn)/Glu-tRNA(Gln) amidotransferase A subunit family amidase